MPRIVKILGLVAASSLLALAIAEASLRVAGFSFDVAPERVEFGWPAPVVREKLYLPDPDLFWVPRNYFGRLAEPTASRLDIAFLGDSCTEFGAYPRLFVERLGAEHPGQPVTWARFGVGGWSSYQGLAQLERDVVPLAPRVVTFYYGWNDHWVGFGVEDAEIRGLRSGAFLAWGSPRLLQLLFKARVQFRRSGTSEWPNRVPLDDFRTNLEKMARVSKRNGIVPVFLTAPSGHQRGAEPEYLKGRYLNDLGDLIPVHHAYAEAVRQVAAAEGAILCDLAAGFAEIPPEERSQRYFRRDGIHASREGDERIAELLDRCFQRHADLRDLWRGRAVNVEARASSR
jgi:lysophospholipase L1-like esterase